MTNEQLRMQMLAGVITESEYKVKVKKTEKIEEGIFGNFLKKIEQTTGTINDVLTIMDLARKDEEGGAEKAVQMLMDKHGMSEEEALKTVTHVYEKFKPWIELTRKNNQ